MEFLTNDELAALDDVAAYELPWGDFLRWALSQQAAEECFDPEEGHTRYRSCLWTCHRAG